MKFKGTYNDLQFGKVLSKQPDNVIISWYGGDLEVVKNEKLLPEFKKHALNNWFEADTVRDLNTDELVDITVY